ncbi:unnamed protein product [Didymodactylos carnosus]|uniref:Uncharacterized protein n=1 Tax=Didymodactylos carnosus TaxID=1234261 RepID=A0A8S2FLH7_9BILA|nr:unnamed protein product [Didymodactylos carnosus]CAF4293364.1 unnamed protein product [Didymodactylos carnosus]
MTFDFVVGVYAKNSHCQRHLPVKVLNPTNSYPRSALDKLRNMLDDLEIEDNEQKRQFFPFGGYNPQQQQQQQMQCTPEIWTCGYDRPQCCPGLTCYHGNAKKGSICVARG